MIEPTKQIEILQAKIEERDKEIKEKADEVEALKLKAKPHSLGFYRSRFR